MNGYEGLSVDSKIALAKARAANVQPSDPWFYISFSGEHDFNGGCVVQAPDAIAAVARTHALGINPGGEALIVEIGDAEIFEDQDRNRLLSKRELIERFDGVRTDGTRA